MFSKEYCAYVTYTVKKVHGFPVPGRYVTNFFFEVYSIFESYANDVKTKAKTMLWIRKFVDNERKQLVQSNTSQRTELVQNLAAYRAGIFKKSMEARNRGGIGLSYRPARLHRLEEFIPWNQFRGPINI
jgi:hypothetical protein